MAVDVTYLEESAVVEMVFRGPPTPAEIDAAMTRAGTIGAENLTNRFLVDAREMPAGGSAFDVLALGELMASLPPGLIEREAIVLSEDSAAAEEMEFFETVCRNRGLDVRVFRERDAALGWLTA
jgi:hypothetical protein